ncbi:MAG TPA: hypothetical protein VMT87_17070 [Vicinamibacteria bacterium]|nr:hypothetical protein [Vicinamibacteria bacterium]
MFESRERLAGDLKTLLEALRRQTDARYVCVLEPAGVLFESPDPDEDGADAALRAFLERTRKQVFGIPAAMAGEAPMEDAFETWPGDEFLLAFINGRVAVVAACPDAERAKEDAFDVLKLMADRLLRYDSKYRLDEKGRGLFLGRARLDVIAVGGTG